MEYQQCGQFCPQTCDTVESTDCVSGCVEGCFCPSGEVLWNGNCINASECAGTYIHMYLDIVQYVIKYPLELYQNVIALIYLSSKFCTIYTITI